MTDLQASLGILSPSVTDFTFCNTSSCALHGVFHALAETGTGRIYGSGRDGLGTFTSASPDAPLLRLCSSECCLIFVSRPGRNCSFVTGRVLETRLSLNSLCALGLSQTTESIFNPPPCLSIRQASVCLPGTSWMLPLCRRQRRYSAAGTMPSRNTKADMMPHLQPVGGMASKRSRCAVKQAFRSLQIVPMAGKHQENNRRLWADINQSIHHESTSAFTDNYLGLYEGAEKQDFSDFSSTLDHWLAS